MKWPALLLAVIQIIGLTSIAWGESAWVLWIEGQQYQADLGRSHSWDVLNAFETREECVKEGNNHISTLEKHNSSLGSKVSKDEHAGRPTLHITAADGGHSVLRTACLPEMVDPRPRELSR